MEVLIIKVVRAYFGSSLQVVILNTVTREVAQLQGCQSCGKRTRLEPTREAERPSQWRIGDSYPLSTVPYTVRLVNRQLWPCQMAAVAKGVCWLRHGNACVAIFHAAGTNACRRRWWAGRIRAGPCIGGCRYRSRRAHY